MITQTTAWPTARFWVASVALVFVVVGISVWGDDHPEPPDRESPLGVSADRRREASRVATAEPTDVKRVVAPGGPGLDSTLLKEWVELQVLDDVSSQPVGGAEVRWCSSIEAYSSIDLGSERESRLRRISDSEEVLVEECGARAKTRNDGRVRIRMPQHGGRVFAYADGRYGTARIGGGSLPEGGWRIRVRQDRAARIQVSGSNGEFLDGIEVELRAAGRPRATRRVLRQTTRGSNGVAVFRHIQVFGSPQAEDARANMEAAICLPGQPRSWVAVGDSIALGRIATLQMPATGRLRARLLHRGVPLIDGISFALCAVGGDLESRRRVYVDADGWARYPHVAVGLEMRLTVYHRHVGVLMSSEVNLPLASEEAERTYDTAEMFTIEGRLVGPGGEAVGANRLAVMCDTEAWKGRADVTIDDHGRFALLLGRGAQDGDGWIDEMHLRYLSLTLSDVQGSLRAMYKDRRLRRGVNDVGVVRFVRDRLVVGGRFDFGGGARVAVPIEVQRLVGGDDNGTLGAWRQVQGLDTSMQGSEVFEVFGQVVPGRYRLRFPGSGYVPVSPIEFSIGAEDLVVEVQLGHPVVAKVLVPEQLNVGLLSAKLVAEAPMRGQGAGGYEAARFRSHSDSVTLQWGGVPQGDYRLELFYLGNSTPVWVAKGIRIPLGNGSNRLEDVDLRSNLRTVEFTIAGRDERAGSQAVTGVVFPGEQPAGSGQWLGWKVSSEGGVVVVPKSDTELLVTSEGYVPRRVVSKEPRARVQLEPWPRVEVTALGAQELPSDIHLWVALKPLTPRVPRSTTYLSGGAWRRPCSVAHAIDLTGAIEWRACCFARWKWGVYDPGASAW